MDILAHRTFRVTWADNRTAFTSSGRPVSASTTKHHPALPDEGRKRTMMKQPIYFNYNTSTPRFTTRAEIDQVAGRI